MKRVIFTVQMRYEIYSFIALELYSWF